TTARRRLTPGAAGRRARSHGRTGDVYAQALASLREAESETEAAFPSSRTRSARALYELRRRYASPAPLSYGPDSAHRLDVWRRPDLPVDSSAPVLLFVPGGGWIHGSRRFQGYALLAHLVEQGWVCVSIDYRVAPHHRWPAHRTDVETALAWTRENVAAHGGDPRFVALAGCSAGGHLASLAGLDPESRVGAVVSLYGRYDWQGRETRERARFMDFLEQVVVQQSQEVVPEVFRDASPLAQVQPGAPPFLVVHGSADTVIPVAQARAFVDALRAVSTSPVLYAELPGAQHAFDLVGSRRTAHTLAAVELFLRATHSAWQQDAGAAAPA
ncbi:MAG: esterase/lipase, partial [Frankiales bacterium]|nr:esterase/lipase [Frankiales bacterium]